MWTSRKYVSLRLRGGHTNARCHQQLTCWVVYSNSGVQPLKVLGPYSPCLTVSAGPWGTNNHNLLKLHGNLLKMLLSYYQEEINIAYSIILFIRFFNYYFTNYSLKIDTYIGSICLLLCTVIQYDQNVHGPHKTQIQADTMRPAGRRLRTPALANNMLYPSTYWRQSACVFF
jgi:hypothetical protein